MGTMEVIGHDDIFNVLRERGTKWRRRFQDDADLEMAPCSLRFQFRKKTQEVFLKTGIALFPKGFIVDFDA